LDLNKGGALSVDEFDGRVAVVTGAGSGIGRAIAHRFAAEGMRLILADIELATVNTAAAELRANGHDAIGVQVDVSRSEDVQRLAQIAKDTFGNIHIVCNNAGIDGYRGGDIWEASEADWERTIGVNLYGVVNGVRTFVPLMLGHGEPSHVVNTASMAGVMKAFSIYGVSKHAVVALTEVLDDQLKKRGARIGVTALCPGTTATRLFDGRFARQPSPAAEIEDDETARMYREARNTRLQTVGAPASAVADKLIAGIRANALYVRTSDEYDDAVRSRDTEILRFHA
jgi:NAD(P)-dependent dehydrogenase (short-subunit alcohol dehydrogenase family)